MTHTGSVCGPTRSAVNSNAQSHQRGVQDCFVVAAPNAADYRERLTFSCCRVPAPR